MKDVLIRPGTPDDDPTIVSIINSIDADLPALTIEILRRRRRNAEKNAQHHAERYVAESDGTVVGFLTLERLLWIKAPNRLEAEIAIHPHHQNQGVGGRLYALLADRVAALGGERVYGYVRDDLPASLHFTADRGFQPTGHADRMSCLDVESADLEGYEGLDDRLQQSGIRITTLAAAGPDNHELLRQVHELEYRAALDIPGSEMRTESWPYQLWYDEMVRVPDRPIDGFFIALHGDRPVGLARLRHHAADFSAFNSFTGVDREYRGLGIARALKLHTLRWARTYGVRQIFTGNDVENTRMLAINVRLGYRPLPTRVEVAKDWL